MKIHVVELSSDEQQLSDSICWNLDELNRKDYDERIETFERIGRLTESLLARTAIPNHRIEYFTNPDMNVGGYGKSRKAVFEKNGTSGQNIFRHPDFIKYLQYFLHGPDLPQATITGFYQIVDERRGTSGEILDQITAFVRKEVREKNLSRKKAAEEFYKLAYEVNESTLAEVARSAALSAR